MTDGQTDGHLATAESALYIRVARKNLDNLSTNRSQLMSWSLLMKLFLLSFDYWMTLSHGRLKSIERYQSARLSVPCLPLAKERKVATTDKSHEVANLVSLSGSRWECNQSSNQQADGCERLTTTAWNMFVDSFACSLIITINQCINFIYDYYYYYYY